MCVFLNVGLGGFEGAAARQHPSPLIGCAPAQLGSNLVSTIRCRISNDDSTNPNPCDNSKFQCVFRFLQGAVRPLGTRVSEVTVNEQTRAFSCFLDQIPICSLDWCSRPQEQLQKAETRMRSRLATTARCLRRRPRHSFLRHTTSPRS